MEKQRKSGGDSLAARMAIGAGLPLFMLLAGLLFLRPEPFANQVAFPCLWQSLTGLHCVGCGASRALQSLLAGRFSCALSQNIFIILWLPPAAYGLGAIWLKAVFGRGIWPPLQDQRWLLWLLLISTVLFAVGRNLPWPPFTYLAP